jgi:hypothetical protein
MKLIFKKYITLINSIMKINEFLTESPTDVVARFYLEAGKDYDRYYNPEDVKYKEKNHKYYEEFFKEWFSDEVVPIFKKPTTKPQPEYTNQPKPGKIQSAGYRGKQYALARAGLPYDKNVQRYSPNVSNMIAPSTMVGSRNNNGN